jgi:hypothetical protein
MTGEFRKLIPNEAPDMIHLSLPLDTFEQFHYVVERARKSKTVTVSTDGLRALLSDHSVCLAALRGRYREQ